MSEGSAEGVVRLSDKDALSLLRLLRGLHCLLGEERLDQRHCAELTGTAPVDDQWQARLQQEAAAACGLLEELLDGYDPAATISPASAARGAPTRG